jgi:hypothetical protein
LDFTLRFLPHKKTLLRNREKAIEVQSDIQQRLLEWMNNHSFSPELVKEYEEIASKFPEI